jgi:predicted site-specific integrase-resolvase
MLRRKGGRKDNAVARAVSAVGGPTKAARICQVSNAAIHKWLRRGRISLLVHAVRLSRASGIPIEEFVGESEEEN